MKGQYRIILETFLILIGIFITSYILANFDALQANINEVAISDNFNTIANDVILGLVTSSSSPSSIIRIEIPEKVSGHVYAINIDGDQNRITVVSLDDTDIMVSKEIFNIGQVNRIISTQIVSSSRIIEIVKENNQIKIRRGI